VSKIAGSASYFPKPGHWSVLLRFLMEPIMHEVLEVLAFTVLILSQLAAVVAVHGWQSSHHLTDGKSSSPTPTDRRILRGGENFEWRQGLCSQW